MPWNLRLPAQGVISNAQRIEAALPTIRHALDNGAKVSRPGSGLAEPAVAEPRILTKAPGYDTLTRTHAVCGAYVAHGPSRGAQG